MGGGGRRIIAKPFGKHVRSLWPSFTAPMLHRRAHSVDHAGFKVEQIRARYVHPARGPVAKHVDEVELRVAVAAVLAVAPEAVLVAQLLLNRGAHIITAPARQYMNNLARRTGPPACE